MRESNILSKQVHNIKKLCNGFICISYLLYDSHELCSLYTYRMHRLLIRCTSSFNVLLFLMILSLFLVFLTWTSSEVWRRVYSTET